VPTLRGKCLSVVRPIRSESVASGFGASVSCFTEFSLPYPFRNDTTRSLEKAEVLPHGPVHTATTSTKSARPSKSSRLRV